MVKCKFCNREFKSLAALSRHLKIHNITSKEYYDNFFSNPSEGVCKLCGKETSYLNITRGYRKFCDGFCGNKDVDKRLQTKLKKYGNDLEKLTKKIKQSNMKKYGVTCTLQLNEVKEKSKQTCLDKYGFENPMQNEEIKYKSIQTRLDKYGKEHLMQCEEFKEKSKQTCLDKYGFENPMQNEEIKEKVRNTLFENYGVTVPLRSEQIKEKSKQTCLDKYGTENPMCNDQINIKVKDVNRFNFLVMFRQFLDDCKLTLLCDEFIDSKYKHNWKCTICNHVFSQTWNEIQQGYDCPICHPRGIFVNGSFVSKPQQELYNLILEMYSDAILNHKELSYSIDITIPDKMIAIEYDGSYWHNKETDSIRQIKLEKEGWKFIRYVDKVPSIEELQKDIKNLEKKLIRDEFGGF